MSFNFRVILQVAGMVSVIIGIAMIPSVIVAFYYGEKAVGFAFIQSMLLAIGIGLCIRFAARPSSNVIKMRDGYLIAALCWFIASAIGAFPYLLSGVIPYYADALFESISGFTTTGSTVLADLSEAPKAIQFWRSLSHWLGAMGILILAISLLPALGIGGLMIASAEAPGPTVEKMTTKISDSSRILYKMYISFTLVEIVLLMFGGLNLFDSMIHTFSSIGTGGLSNYAKGIGHFDSIFIEFVIILFSIIASINFVLYHQILEGKWKDFFKDKELRTFLLILAVSAVMITLNLWTSGAYDLGRSVRYSMFQTTAFISTSGFAITDYTLWPSFSQMLLFCLMFIGGCSASTCGSVKVIRVMIVFKLIVRGIYKRLHSNAVVPVKIGNRTISAETVSKVSSFTILYFTIFIFSCLLLSLENHDLLTTISAVASSLSNTGMGLGFLGPNGNYSIFSQPSRLYLGVLMIAGRLELFAIIMLLSPAFWRAR